MRKRFTRALYAISAAAVAASGLSAGVAGAATHTQKDTVACGGNCISIFSLQLGSRVTMNAFVPGDTGTGGKIGQKVNLHLAANDRPNGDWQRMVDGFVFQFCGFVPGDIFPPTSYICHHYPFFDVAEFVWSPFGNQSLLCAGVARGNTNGENITLQPCGMSAKTAWVLDRNHLTGGSNLDCRDPATPPVAPGDTTSTTFCPYLNGADMNFSQPLVLTLDTGTVNPTNQLRTVRESLVGGRVRSNQLFAFYFGPV